MQKPKTRGNMYIACAICPSTARAQFATPEHRVAREAAWKELARLGFKHVGDDAHSRGLGYGHDHGRPRPHFRDELHASAKLPHALSNALNPNADGGATGNRGRSRKTLSAIAYFQPYFARVATQVDAGGLAARVPVNVGKTLLEHPK